MAQFSRPDSDASIGNFEDELGGTSNIFNSIDEVSPDDNDFITFFYFQHYPESLFIINND